MACAPNDVRARNVTLIEAITILTSILVASYSISKYNQAAEQPNWLKVSLP